MIKGRSKTANVGADMSSTTTKVMAVRVKNRTYEFFYGKPLNRIVESLHERYESGEIGITADGRVFVPSGYDKRKDSSI